MANNYFWGPEDGSGASGINHYRGIVHGADAFSLVANNIVYNSPGQFEFNGVNIGGVLAYNYGRLTWFNSFADHDKGSQFYLIEGNDVTGFTADITHGISAFGTLFRSRFAGDNTGATDDTCVWIQPYHRFYNMIGCVIGNSGNGSYESSAVNNNLGDAWNSPGRERYVHDDHGWPSPASNGYQGKGHIVPVGELGLLQ